MRVATTVKKEDGSSAVGTPLAANSPALAKLNNGEPYYGDATVFGKAYDAGYEPIGKRDKVRRDDRRSPKDCYGSEKPVCRAHSLPVAFVGVSFQGRKSTQSPHFAIARRSRSTASKSLAASSAMLRDVALSMQLKTIALGTHNLEMAVQRMFLREQVDCLEIRTENTVQSSPTRQK